MNPFLQQIFKTYMVLDENNFCLKIILFKKKEKAKKSNVKG